AACCATFDVVDGPAVPGVPAGPPDVVGPLPELDPTWAEPDEVPEPVAEPAVPAPALADRSVDCCVGGGLGTLPACCSMVVAAVVVWALRASGSGAIPNGSCPGSIPNVCPPPTAYRKKVA